MSSYRVAYLGFGHFRTAIALLPIPDRYIVIGGFIDSAQIISAVRLGERQAENRSVKFAIADHAESRQAHRIPYSDVWLKFKNLMLFIAL